MRLNEIYAAYRDKVHCYCVYVREAHPDDGWRVPENIEQAIHYNEPTTDEERTAVAHVCQTKLDLQLPMLIDRIDNDAEEKYISMPMRLFLIDRDGVINYTGEQGPFGFKPDEWAAAIQACVAAQR